ncbi:MAG TPA: hypothetical protein VHY08_21200 [Bacillota bacterium]|nr:hypothetical protein [Bacillota bacterium]
MLKRIGLLTILLLVLVFSITIQAIDPPKIFQSTFTVTGEGGRFQVGFVNVEFKKDALVPTILPATFTTQVYAENGVVYIEFDPNTPPFFKKVHLRTDKYQGLLYDRAIGRNITVNIKHQQVLVDHFSRYAFN